MAVQLVVVGLSHVLRPAVWARFFIRLRERGEPGVFVVGLLTLGYGAFIAAFHNVWDGIPLVLTLYGWFQAIKGVVYLTFPRAGLRALATISEDRRKGFVAAGAFMLLLGALLVVHLHRSWPIG